jgi:hypothetical protein
MRSSDSSLPRSSRFVSCHRLQLSIIAVPKPTGCATTVVLPERADCSPSPSRVARRQPKHPDTPVPEQLSVTKVSTVRADALVRRRSHLAPTGCDTQPRGSRDLRQTDALAGSIPLLVEPNALSALRAAITRMYYCTTVGFNAWRADRSSDTHRPLVREPLTASNKIALCRSRLNKF